MNIDKLAEVICTLKDTPRNGWIRREVENRNRLPTIPTDCVC